MLKPQQQRYADRIRALIDEGKSVARLERPSSVGLFIQDDDAIPLQAWMTKASNIIETVFGPDSPQSRQLKELMPYGVRHIQHSHDVLPIVGLLSGALDDLENGYLVGQEFLIAGEVLDSVLVQARNLASSGYKDPGAVLARVALEDALKRVARSEGIDDVQKASGINDELKKIGKYPQSQWRLIQAWLDIGNAAAHGNFDEYSTEDVDRMLDGIEGFLSGVFH